MGGTRENFRQRNLEKHKNFYSFSYFDIRKLIRLSEEVKGSHLVLREHTEGFVV